MAEVKKDRYKALARAHLVCLRDMAKFKELSQEALSEATGISQPNIGRVLSGKNIPKLDTFIKLCEAIGVPYPDPCKQNWE